MREDIIKRKRGRPRKNESMQERFIMYMTDDMSRRLNDLHSLTGLNKADIFREAFDMYEKLKLIQNKNDDADDYYNYDSEYFEDDFDEI